MPFSFIFILETVVTKLANVLLLRFMVSKEEGDDQLWNRICRVGYNMAHFSSCNVSNFLGFFGQHSQIWFCILGAVECFCGIAGPDILRAIAAVDWGSA